MNKQFIISESDILKRNDFYNYITNNYSLKILYPFKKDKFINNIFPFIVDLKRKEFWICESITCLACAASNNKIITIEKFKKMKEGI